MKYSNLPLENRKSVIVYTREVYIPKQEDTPLTKDFRLRWVSLTASRTRRQSVRGIEGSEGEQSLSMDL